MTSTSEHASQPLSVFLCHSSGDKPRVRELYGKLKSDAILPWLDEESLIAGQVWEREIKKAINESDVVLVCLSRGSVTREGFIQKEIRFALDVAAEKPEGAIFLIPVKLEVCETLEQLKELHYVKLFEERGYDLLLKALRVRAEVLNRLPVSLPQQSDDRDWVWSLLLRPSERKHLKNLVSGDTKNYVGRHNLRMELRNLRELGLIRSRKPIGSSEDAQSFDLGDLVAVTDRGREYLIRMAYFQDMPS